MWFTLFLVSAVVLTFAIPIRLLFWVESNASPDPDSDPYGSPREDGVF